MSKSQSSIENLSLGVRAVLYFAFAYLACLLFFVLIVLIVAATMAVSNSIFGTTTAISRASAAFGFTIFQLIALVFGALNCSLGIAASRREKANAIHTGGTDQ